MRVNPARLLDDVEKVVIAASLDGSGTFGVFSGLAVEVAAGTEAPPAVSCDLVAGPETAVVFAEVYRRAGEWKVRAVGQDVLKSLSPGQALVKVVSDELTAVMGAANSELNLAALSSRLSARSCIDACLDVSSYLHSVMNRTAMPSSETRKVSRISPGIEPPVWLSTRGCVNDSAIRTARKLSGTNAPAVIANTAAVRAWRPGSSIANRSGW